MAVMRKRKRHLKDIDLDGRIIL